jgi:hypothetical protein
MSRDNRKKPAFVRKDGTTRTKANTLFVGATPAQVPARMPILFVTDITENKISCYISAGYSSGVQGIFPMHPRH